MIKSELQAFLFAMGLMFTLIGGIFLGIVYYKDWLSGLSAEHILEGVLAVGVIMIVIATFISLIRDLREDRDDY